MAGAIGKGRMYGITAQQRYGYAAKFFCHGMFRMSMAMPGHALYTPRRCEGVGRHELP